MSNFAEETLGKYYINRVMKVNITGDVMGIPCGPDGNGTLPLCPASILKAHNPSLNT